MILTEDFARIITARKYFDYSQASVQEIGQNQFLVDNVTFDLRFNEKTVQGTMTLRFFHLQQEYYWDTTNLIKSINLKTQPTKEFSHPPKPLKDGEIQDFLEYIKFRFRLGPWPISPPPELLKQLSHPVKTVEPRMK